MYACMHVCMFVCMYVCMHVHIYIYAEVHIYIYIIAKFRAGPAFAEYGDLFAEFSIFRGVLGKNNGPNSANPYKV